ncbi:MAG: hypothetical protein ABIU87_10780 [Ornithinibacter sp.]
MAGKSLKAGLSKAVTTGLADRFVAAYVLVIRADVADELVGMTTKLMWPRCDDLNSSERRNTEGVEVVMEEQSTRRGVTGPALLTGVA